MLWGLMGLSLSLFPWFELSGFSGAAYAESKQCVRLERKLASLKRGGGGSKRYARAVIKQQKQIDKVRSSMRSRACTAKKRFFKREAHPSCGNLRSTLKRMQKNLAALKRRAGSTGGSSSERSKVRRAMRKAGCGSRKTIAEQIFGEKKKAKRRRQAALDRKKLRTARKKQDRSFISGGRNFSGVRTVCVRTCDGYHFPINLSARQSTKQDQDEACTALCPGTQMELFYQEEKNNPAENLISSVSGEPYYSLPNAFAYQESYNPSCACNYRLLKRQSASVVDLPSQQTAAADSSGMTEPVTGPKLQTEAKKEPKQTEPKTEETGGTRPFAERPLDENRQVRVIGEPFLPTQ